MSLILAIEREPGGFLEMEGKEREKTQFMLLNLATDFDDIHTVCQ